MPALLSPSLPWPPSLWTGSGLALARLYFALWLGAYFVELLFDATLLVQAFFLSGGTADHALMAAWALCCGACIAIAFGRAVRSCAALCWVTCAVTTRTLWDIVQFDDFIAAHAALWLLLWPEPRPAQRSATPALWLCTSALLQAVPALWTTNVPGFAAPGWLHAVLVAGSLAALWPALRWPASALVLGGTAAVLVMNPGPRAALYFAAAAILAFANVRPVADAGVRLRVDTGAAVGAVYCALWAVLLMADGPRVAFIASSVLESFAVAPPRAPTAAPWVDPYAAARVRVGDDDHATLATAGPLGSERPRWRVARSYLATPAWRSGKSMARLRLRTRLNTLLANELCRRREASTAPILITRPEAGGEALRILGHVTCRGASGTWHAGPPQAPGSRGDLRWAG